MPEQWKAVEGSYEDSESTWSVLDESNDAVCRVLAGEYAACLIAQAPAMYELLRELEWFEHHESRTDLKCPVCGAYQPAPSLEQHDGHESDCRLAAVLKAVEGET